MAALRKTLFGPNLQVLSLLGAMKRNRDPAAIRDPHELRDIEYTIAPVRLAVAENGAVWIGGADLVTRNAVFICEHRIAAMEDRGKLGAHGSRPMSEDILRGA